MAFTGNWLIRADHAAAFEGLENNLPACSYSDAHGHLLGRAHDDSLVTVELASGSW